MKKTLLFILALIIMPILTQAQDGAWTYEGIFPPDSSVDEAIYNIAVDGEGKVWMHDFYSRGNLRSDSSVAVVDLLVFNEDGTPADFSPVQQVTIDDSTYTFAGSNGRGMAATADGNILYAHGANLFLIDHETGEGIAHVAPGLGSLTTPAVDRNGNIYVAAVAPGNGIKQYNADLDTTETNGEVVIDAVPGYGRTVAVSKDGNSVFAPRYDLYRVLVYNRTDLTPFGVADTVLEGAFAESIAIDGNSGDVWISTGSAPDSASGYTPYTWYGFNPETWEKTDSITWVGADSLNAATQPQKAISFDNTANTLYLGVWRNNVDMTYAVQKFTRDTPVNIEDPITSIPTGYKLEQNYPNPFNPTTNINYTLKESGNVTLKVFDITGREVATLVNTRMSAGTHTATFDASRLASGVYLYQLQANGVRLTNRMTLIK